MTKKRPEGRQEDVTLQSEAIELFCKGRKGACLRGGVVWPGKSAFFLKAKVAKSQKPRRSFSETALFGRRRQDFAIRNVVSSFFRGFNLFSGACKDPLCAAGCVCTGLARERSSFFSRRLTDKKRSVADVPQDRSPSGVVWGVLRAFGVWLAALVGGDP